MKTATTLAPLTLSHRREAMLMREPFRISGYVFESMPAVITTVSDGAFAGRGEAAGVYYLHDDPEHIAGEIERCRAAIEAGIDRQALRALLPPGGARNALDCALWELESLRAGVPVWQLAGVAAPKPLITTFTLPADDPAEILRRLDALPPAKAIKLKLDGDLAADRERVRAVRAARPDVWLGVDANQGYGGDDLDGLVAMLVDQQVSLLEQPIRRGEEALLDGWRSPIPVAADESVLDLAELDAQRHRFQVINIKLDKCGGLTEGLMMAEHARALGLKVMVGNMAGATLSTAPAFVLGQLCDIVDLDGPWFLLDDPLAAGLYTDGEVMVPARLWGAA
ncbi:dipeptide epimerase [Sphingomonas sp. AR_OL41]|uniref:dipeptide epimerase n=1 Tax=Sphingomonas sp. AR_OL41 TaxID=3042729 RepID=UPI002480B0BC|nr:dipeptide epimerase [Sphingomonas sp. AR_OL41]MDH7973118.1 dipeptide epimerase [Sphingomonas sp. AR_OL41]